MMMGKESMSEPTNEQCRQMLFAMAEGDDNSLAAWATRRITALEQKVAEARAAVVALLHADEGAAAVLFDHHCPLELISKQPDDLTDSELSAVIAALAPPTQEDK